MSCRVAYLVSYYPGISHTFILREVQALRALGADVLTVSVRPAPTAHLLSEADREAAAETPVLVADRRRLLRSHLQAALLAPGTYARSLRRALGRGRGARGRLWQLFYWAEAVPLWALCRDAGLRHVHAHFANNAADIARTAADLGSDLEPEQPWTWSFTMHGPTEFAEVTRYGLAGKVRDADLVVCISDFARSQLMSLVPESHWPKLAVVHCGVDPARFTPREPAAVLTEGGSDARQPLRVLCLGRLVPEKGQAVLVQAVAALREQGVPVQLALVGGGPSEESLRAAVQEAGLQDQVQMPGPVGQDRLLDWYRWADVFCLPSFQEGVPVVLMEAMASGLPVVTTRIAGIGELVEDGHSGVLLPPGRVDLLAGALRDLAEDDGLRRRLGSAGRRRVQAEFDSSVEAGKLLDLLVTRLPHTAGAGVAPMESDAA